MRLRSLEDKDIPYMLEWLTDCNVYKHFRFNGSKYTTEDAKHFIENAKILATKNQTFHYAIVDEHDEYVGTVSLKNIDEQAKTAEYAIAIRASKQGSGIGYEASKLVLHVAFAEKRLNRVYLNVLSDNQAAIRMYRKLGFSQEGEFRDHVSIQGEIKTLLWFGMLRREYKETESENCSK